MINSLYGDSTMYQKNDIEIDEKKVDALMSSIIMMENLNLRTHAKSDSQMIADIQEKIANRLANVTKSETSDELSKKNQ